MGEVADDLLLEGFEVGEFHLIPEFCDEGDFKFSTIEITGEIEQMHLGVELGSGFGAGGTKAEVEGGGVGVRVDAGENGVNPVGWQGESTGVEIGGGKTEATADLIAGDDGAGEGVGAAEHLAGGVQVAGADGGADAGAADGLAVEGDGGEVVDGEVEFGTELAEQFDIAGAAVSEGEVGADADAVDVAEVVDKAADEVGRGQFTEGAVEVEEQGGIHAEGFDAAEFLGEGTDERRDAVGGDDGGGVGVEGDDDGFGAVLAGVHQGLTDDLLVTKMYAVKGADGEADAAGVGGEVERGAQE